MIIRKKFSFEAAHVVRNCSTERCSKTIHGHSYIVEVFVTSMSLDNANMVLDFSLFKPDVGKVIDLFDHAYVAWRGDKPELNEMMRDENERYIEMPYIPSAEIFALIFAGIIDKQLRDKEYVNGEVGVMLSSVRVHETATGWAEATMVDVQNILPYPKVLGEIFVKHMEDKLW